MSKKLKMKTAATYTHPTLDHFLRFHLGPLSFDLEGSEVAWTSQRIMVALTKKGFPFSDTYLGADVHLLDKSLVDANKLTLMCAEGEASHMGIAFLVGKVLTDRDNNRKRDYGPVTITSKDNHEACVAYYDNAVRSIFASSVVQTLFADPATMKTSWYGKVNSFDQKKYLEEIIDQLVSLQGISSLLASQLNTKRGASILIDGARSSSLAISLIRLLNQGASDRLIFTMGFVCFVQHFGALFNNEQSYYSGKIYRKPDEATLAILASLGINDDGEGLFSEIDVDLKEVLSILRYNPGSPEKKGSGPTALYSCFSVTNHIVATFFTEHKRVYEDGAYTFKRNPSFGHVERTMERLDEVFSDNLFYQFHREKIKRFIYNAGPYYRLHIRSKMVDGGFVSSTQIQAFQSK